MQKYKIVVFVLLSVCPVSLSFAAEKPTAATSQIESNVFQQASAEVQSIEINFCESLSKTKEYIITAGDPTDICLEAENTSEKDIAVSLDFVDGTFTNDQRKNRACLDSNQKEIFGQYITGNQKILLVPAKSSLRTHATLHYPKNKAGKFNGCLVYYTKWVSVWGNMDFSVLVRRAKFIDITLVPPFFSRYQWYIFGGIGILVVMLAIMVLIRKKRKII